MRIFYRRPLALVCAVFMAAALIGFLVRAEVKFVVFALLVIGAIAAFFLFSVKRIQRGGMTLAVISIIAAMLALLESYIYFNIFFADSRKYTGELHTIEGEVLERRYTGSFSSGFGVRIKSIDNKKQNIKAILDCEFLSDLQPGYSFKATATAEELGYGEGNIAARLSAMSDGYVIRFVIESDADYEISEPDRGSFNFSLWLKDANRRAASTISRKIGGKEGRLAAALALGRAELLDASVQRDFRRSGTTHLLALSGLHFTILMGAAELILKRACVHKRLRCVILLLSSLFFLAFTGFALSAVRAAAMLVMVYLSFFFWRRPDSLTSLFFAGAAVLALSPTAVADCGFWLSFTATLGIIVGVSASEGLVSAIEGLGTDKDKSDKTAKKSRKTRKTLSAALKYPIVSVITTLSANCAVAFCVWLFFGEMSLAIIPANLILGPISTGVLLATVFFVLFSNFSALAFAAGFFEGFARLGSRFMIIVAGWFSQRLGAVISLGYAFAGVIIVGMSIAYLVLCIIRLRRKWVMAMPLLCAIIMFSASYGVYGAFGSSRATVTYIKEKSSEMLMISANGGVVICDLSDGSKSRIYAALEEARKANVTEVDVFVITHYHQKHIPAAEYLFSREIVRHLWLPEPIDEREFGVMLSLIQAAEEHGVLASIYAPGSRMTVFDNAEMTVKTEYIKRSTHPVITLSFESGGERFTYVGASVGESRLSGDVIAEISQSSDVLLGVHGPVEKGSYSPEFDFNNLKSITFSDEAALLAFTVNPDTINRLDGVKMTIKPSRCIFTYKLGR